MNKPIPAGDEEVVYKGRIFEVVKQPMRVGDKVIDFETVRRSPGVRLIFEKDGKLLLTKEYRTELNGYDYRLPGGKVFDTLDELHAAYERKADMLEEAKNAARREGLEEVGLEVKTLDHFHTTSPDATVLWNLYYFVTKDFKKSDGDDGVKKREEEGEIIHPEWRTLSEVKRMCHEGEIKEDRTVAVLLRYIEQYESK